MRRRDVNARPRIARTLGWWLLCLMLAAGGTVARGQQNRRDRLTVQAPVAPLRITGRSGEIGVEAHVIQENESSNGTEVELSNRTFREYILQRLNGYVYHPRFVEFRTRVEMGLMQQTVERSGLGDTDDSSNWNGWVHGYDIYLQFLKDHPVSAMVFANKDRRAIIELFTDRQLVETERYGVVLNLKRGPLPMDLSLTQAKIEEFGADSHSTANIDTLDYVVRNSLGRWMQQEFRYRYQDYRQDFSARTPLLDIERRTHLETHDFSYLNSIYFNESRTSYLSSLVRFAMQSGDQELDNSYWQERLHLQHTPNFETYYLASVLENNFEQSSVRTTRAEAGLEHRLYESLHTHFDVHGREVEFDESTDTEQGVTGRLNYNKRTPAGHLTAGYGRTLDSIERGGSTSEQTIIDEPLTLNDVTFTFLARPGVTRIIQVTLPDGVTGLFEDLDYEVERLGNVTGLRLLPGGRFGESAAVLVDYDIESTRSIDYIADSENIYLRHDFDRWVPGVGVYYRRHELAARGAPTDDDFSVLEFTDWLAGIQYRWRWLTWTEEYEVYESNFTGYTQVRSQVEGYHRLENGVRLAWHAGNLMIDHDEDESFRGESSSDIWFAGLTLDGRIRTNGFWSIEARARREDGITEEELFGIAAKLGARWRRLRLESGLRIEQRERFESQRDRYQLFFQLAREF